MPLPLVDGKLNFKGATLAEVAATLYAELASRAGFTVPPLSDVADVEAIPARINHGRWCADCPDCNGAEFVWLDGPYLMLCVGCWNSAVGNRWRPVKLPTAKTRARIVELLTARPMPANRNWTPGERTTDLERENVAHGIEG